MADEPGAEVEGDPKLSDPPMLWAKAGVARTKAKAAAAVRVRVIGLAPSVKAFKPPNDAHREKLPLPLSIRRWGEGPARADTASGKDHQGPRRGGVRF